MKGFLRQVVASLVIIAGLACGKPQPIVPRNPVPAGTALFQFTMKVEGPVELTIDGTRIPVAKLGKKKCRHLEVSGLAEGSHRFVLMSPREAFGPDQFDVQVGAAQGEFKVMFAQQIQSVLYGTPEPSPSAIGLPGVKASLQP